MCVCVCGGGGLGLTFYRNKIIFSFPKAEGHRSRDMAKLGTVGQDWNRMLISQPAPAHPWSCVGVQGAVRK